MQTKCPLGKYGTVTNAIDDATGCTTCTVGYFCAGGSSRISCPNGTYGDAEGQFSETSCKNCEIGYYCSGGSHKQACDAGKYNSEPGRSSSLSCLGKFYLLCL